MLLQIDDKFRVTSDSAKMNFQLEKLQPVINKKTREVVREEWGQIGAHGNSMRSVLLQYRNEAVIDDDNLKNINDVLHKLDQINITIERVVKRENIKLEPTQND